MLENRVFGQAEGGSCREAWVSERSGGNHEVSFNEDNN